MQDERVRHIMTATVLSIGVHEPISEVSRLFATHTLHHLPVVDGLELKGMLSSADLLKLKHFVPNSGSLASAAKPLMFGLLAATSSSALNRRPVISTFAPFTANSRAVAKPIPAPPPVMMATLSLNVFM